ncbi:Eco57I restriction-modification methylase domain-containing protein [Streptosporangium sp. NPDC006007]|uniref:Eco57I restriction-modification methylase domain-containing protein n=1 Tax=Streptosporangium sp. NPDC006007 TaxID=3154575 RepID=UPI0033ABF139
MNAIEDLVSRTEERRRRVSAGLDSKRRTELGQFFTPSLAAHLIAEMPHFADVKVMRLLDPGAGVGSLATAFLARLARQEWHGRVEVVAVEIDNIVFPHLEETLKDCAETLVPYGIELEINAICGDLIQLGTGLSREISPFSQSFDVVIMNPPYKKLGAKKKERLALAAQGVDCSNIYSAFMALGVMSLRPGGQLGAITPRSFANGPYFEEFRRFFLESMALDRIHVFESRSKVFADTEVLQENVIFSATRAGSRERVVLSVSEGYADVPTSRTVSYVEVVKHDDPHRFIHIPADESDTETAEAIANLPCSLSDLGMKVSTGKVVDFRAREHIKSQPGEADLPLIYPGNLREGRVSWPLPLRKPQAIADLPDTQKLLLPGERFVLVNRFSAKEERRRVVAVVYEPDDIRAPRVGFENHLNVFRGNERGLDREVSYGLCLWLNSSIVDKFFRMFSGHTQVNATDLRSLRYPSLDQLASLGAALGQGSWPDQEKIDSLVASHVLTAEARP